jgi:hypothetical protein
LLDIEARESLALTTQSIEVKKTKEEKIIGIMTLPPNTQPVERRKREKNASLTKTHKSPPPPPHPRPAHNALSQYVLI